MKMWPLLLDMSKVDCKRMLRRLELEAYGTMVSALRAQGGLSSEKRKLLQEISSTLNIPQERHRAEIRRAVNDERLATVAYCMTGDDTTDEWAQEGRRLVPLMPRMVPQTAYSVIADEEANKASIENEKLPPPSSTERKRPLQTNTSEPNRNIQYATSEFSATKYAAQCAIEEGVIKKRKPNLNVEGSTLAQHLIMGPPKISRIQQLYRQKNKAILKQQIKQQCTSAPVSQPVPTQHITNIQKTHRKVDDDIKIVPQTVQQIVPVSKQPTVVDNKIVNSSVTVGNNAPVVSENNVSQNKVTAGQSIVSKTPTTSTNAIKVQAPVVVNANEVTTKSIKICPARKVVTAGSRVQPQSQKLIIVSNSQGNTTSSILQRTLTIPYVKTISMKNLDKLKVISTTSSASTNNATTSVTTQKPKFLAVTKMKNSSKPISIPFIQSVQLQALQNKGAIKMIPLSTTTKITTSKPTVINTTSGSVYIMNSNTNISAVTTSNASPIMTTKPQTPTEDVPQKNVYVLKNDDAKPPTVSVINNSEGSILNQNVVLLNVPPKVEQKSSVLTDILKASGVIPNDEPEQEVVQDETDMTSQDLGDIESQISQFTVATIPNTREVECTPQGGESEQNEVLEEPQESQEDDQYENMIDEGNATTDTTEESNYVILEGTEEAAGDTEMLMCEMEDEQQKQNGEVLEVMGNLDPETGMYSIQESVEETDENVEHIEEQEQTGSYVIELDNVHNSELDMPTLSLN